MNANTIARSVLALIALSGSVLGQTLTIDFDNPVPPGTPDDLLNGTFEGIDWGEGLWRWSPPFSVNPTNNVFFADSSGTSRTFTFTPAPRLFQSVEVYTLNTGTLTISDDQGQTVSQPVSAGALQTVATNWTQGSTVVTVDFTQGWDLGLDNIVHSDAGGGGQQFVLTVNITGEGSGTVVSQPPGIDCRPQCSTLFAMNALVQLAAFPETGSFLDGISGDPDCEDGRVTMLSDLSCTFAFSLAGTGGAGYALDFFGTGVGAPDRDRVKILIDDVTTDQDPAFPLDVGGEDFTIEFWIRASAAENTAPPVLCGANDDWIFGNIVIDRDRFSQGRDYGLSIAGGILVFGVTNETGLSRSICGVTNVLDGEWHHVAIQRRMSDGRMWLFVDGFLDVEQDGPNGNISYPDDGVPVTDTSCGGPCVDSDPYLVIGAEKHDVDPLFPSYSGLVDEMRVSNVLRYVNPFTRPTQVFVRDPNTVALYHFDEGAGEVLHDSLFPREGPRDGVLRPGGDAFGPRRGPKWTISDAPFSPAP